MSKHTPGPWTTNATYPDLIQHDTKRKGDRLWVAEASLRNTKDEQLANARLIAESPALLEALKEMINQFATIPGMSKMVHDEKMAVLNANEVIARAEGKE